MPASRRATPERGADHRDRSCERGDGKALAQAVNTLCRWLRTRPSVDLPQPLKLSRKNLGSDPSIHSGHRPETARRTGA